MKYLVYVIAIALFLGGCSYKNGAVSLKSYESDYTGTVQKNKRGIYIEALKDIRADKRDIGYAEVKGKKDVTFRSDVDFVQKYRYGLGRALAMAGFNTDVSGKDASLTIEVYIKNIKIVYEDKTFDENLKGEIDLQVIVKKDAKTTTLDFKERKGKWIAPSYDSRDIEPFLYTMFAQSINDIVSRLADY
ncbi:YajG family lipoprotein [Sulfurimonas sp. HSL-1716]|uniref:YajG family lipoprotein n=1 Tax=Hydrocurvibacter sulfurireducens TaxID=3131937 RepID=UPI0031F784FC